MYPLKLLQTVPFTFSSIPCCTIILKISNFYFTVYCIFGLRLDLTSKHQVKHVLGLKVPLEAIQQLVMSEWLLGVTI